LYFQHSHNILSSFFSSPSEIITRDEVRSKIEALDSAGVNMVGADLVVACWRDPAFQQRLVDDGE
jgi:hypothetical protein